VAETEATADLVRRNRIEVGFSEGVDLAREASKRL